MKRKFSRKIEQIFMWTLVIGLLGSLSFKAASGRQRYSPSLSRVQKLIVIVFDFKSFFCPLCLDSVKDFCDTLHSRDQDEFAIGVLVYESSDKKDEERSKKVIEKKLRGFIIGNSIQFPVILDHFHVFKDLIFEDTGIILLDRSRKILKKYSFPLTNKQLDEIFSFKDVDPRKDR